MFLFALVLAVASTTAFSTTPNSIIEGTVSNQWVQGGLRVTDRQLDIAIQGNGFFMIENANGVSCFTRLGKFELTRDGFLRHLDLDGDLVSIVNSQKLERLQLNNIARWRDGVLKSLRFDLDGKIFAIYSNGLSKQVARLAIALFQNQRRLQRINDHCFNPTDDSGDPYLSYAQVESRGSIYSHTLEELDDEIYGMALD